MIALVWHWEFSRSELTCPLDALTVMNRRLVKERDVTKWDESLEPGALTVEVALLTELFAYLSIVISSPHVVTLSPETRVGE